MTAVAAATATATTTTLFYYSFIGGVSSLSSLVREFLFQGRNCVHVRVLVSRHFRSAGLADTRANTCASYNSWLSNVFFVDVEHNANALYTEDATWGWGRGKKTSEKNQTFQN